MALLDQLFRLRGAPRSGPPPVTLGALVSALPASTEVVEAPLQQPLQHPATIPGSSSKSDEIARELKLRSAGALDHSSAAPADEPSRLRSVSNFEGAPR